MEIQSNYPRNKSDHLALIDLAKLNRAAWIASALAVIYSLTVILFGVFARVFLDPRRDGETLHYVGKFGVIVFTLLGLFACHWIAIAFDAVQTIRKIRPWQSSVLKAFSCFICGFLLFIPLSLTMDFLLSRSDPKDIEPMKWYWPVSRIPLSNAFFLTLTLSILLSIVAFGAKLDSNLFNLSPGLLLVSAVLIGARIAFIVNSNLAKLVETDQSMGA